MNDRKNKKRTDVDRTGHVRGWHRDCPSKTEAWSLGTYALVPGPKGTVDCEACGAKDLVTRRTV